MTAVAARSPDLPVSVAVEGEHLTAARWVPPDPGAVVVVANDSGCSRHSSQVGAIARALYDVGIATVVVDLLTPLEQAGEEAPHLRQDMVRLAGRLAAARRWLRSDAALRSLRVGYLGLGGAAGAVLLEAGARPADAAAVAAIGQRPDLAGFALSLVSCPTLVIAEPRAKAPNALVFERLRCEKKLVDLPEVEGPLSREVLGGVIAAWFASHLVAPRRPERTRPADPAVPRYAASASP